MPQKSILRLTRGGAPISRIVCMPSISADKNSDTFESAVKKLESIITKIESSDVTLEQSLKLFEDGVRLMRTCENHLSNAEGKIKELLRGEDGALVERVLGSSIDFLHSGENHES